MTKNIFYQSLTEPDTKWYPGFHRILSNCPKCSHQNKNEEAKRNFTGLNPLKTHPSDVTCQTCHHIYCSDCLDTHPGIICRGFCKNEINFGDDVSCPGCRQPALRVSCDDYMVCQNILCGITWCWHCRCFRDKNVVGQDTIEHFCITRYRYHLNRDWVKKNDITIYTTLSPQCSSVV